MAPVQTSPSIFPPRIERGPGALQSSFANLGWEGQQSSSFSSPLQAHPILSHPRKKFPSLIVMSLYVVFFFFFLFFGVVCALARHNEHGLFLFAHRNNTKSPNKKDEDKQSQGAFLCADRSVMQYFEHWPATKNMASFSSPGCCAILSVHFCARTGVSHNILSIGAPQQTRPFSLRPCQ